MERKNMLKGPVLKAILSLALPLFISNLLQQFYNIADTVIVGRYIGPDALAAVGSAFSLMNFITSIIFGFALGSSSIFSIRYGQKDHKGLKESVHASFLLIMFLTLVLNILSYVLIDQIIVFLRVPKSIVPMLKEYLLVIFAGFFATSLFNYTASLYRALGDSKTPMVYLSLAVILNIILDIVFIKYFNMGIFGAAFATVIAQYLSGLLLFIHAYIKLEEFRPKAGEKILNFKAISLIAKYSVLTSIQQSIMNFGILMIQGLINSFGPSVMAAFAACVKIDAFAYMPVQDFGNSLSVFIAQNFGAKNFERIKEGMKKSIVLITAFSLAISGLVFVFAKYLLKIFIDPKHGDIIEIGISYLRTEGAFYIGIGYLFMLYGLYRALAKPSMSIVLTVFSLGTRVALAYYLSAIDGIGIYGIWWSIVIGWFIADTFGFVYYLVNKNKIFSNNHVIK